MKRLNKLVKKAFVLLLLVSFISTSAFAVSIGAIESAQNGLNELNSTQSELAQASSSANSISKKISAALKQINSAISSPGNSCGNKLRSAFSRLNFAIALLNKRSCSQSMSANCVEGAVVDQYLPQLQDLLQSVKSAATTDDDGNHIPDICDSDPDGDGIPSVHDNCPLVKNPLQRDNDENGIGDLCDLFTCCDSSDPADRDSCTKKTAQTCREDGGVITSCMKPLKRGKPTLDSSGGSVLSFTVIQRTSNSFNCTGDPVPLFQTSGGTIIGGNTSGTTTGGTTGGTHETTSGGTSGSTADNSMTGGNTTTESNEDFLKRLQDAVSMSKVPSMDYTEDYICSDFAGDLEEELEGEGFNATFTAIWTDTDPKSKTVDGHALTDVHTPDGGIIWIEPQTGEIVDLDEDGDGKVMASDGKHSDDFMATEGMSQIEVYDSKDAAAMAGVPMK